MNFLGNGIEDIMDVGRVDDIIGKTLATFEKVFPICYKNALLETIMNRGKVTPDTSYVLLSAPLPSTPLKKGVLKKRGQHRKNWKTRWFTALNEADNYAIYYGTTESPGSEISRFSCSGYRVESFTADETEIFGPHGIKLAPLNDAKRCWWFCAGSAEEHTEWVMVSE